MRKTSSFGEFVMAGKFTLISLFLFVVLLGVGALYISNERKVETQIQNTDGNWALIARDISPNDHVLGSISAPVQVIVYSDFECKYCARFFNTSLPKLQTEYGNDIVVAFRHLPLLSTRESHIQAEASECIYLLAGDEAFWKFVRTTYSRPIEASVGIDEVTNLASRLQINKKDFSSCMSEGRGKARVDTDAKEASIAGMRTTPSILLKSKNRAFIIVGDYYAKISTGIQYLQDISKQINSLKHI